MLTHNQPVYHPAAIDRELYHQLVVDSQSGSKRTCVESNRGGVYRHLASSEAGQGLGRATPDCGHHDPHAECDFWDQEGCVHPGQCGVEERVGRNESHWSMTLLCISYVTWVKDGEASKPD